MSSALVLGAVAGLGVAVPIGAVGTYLVTITAHTSWPTGLFAAAGVALVDGGYCAVVVLSGRALASDGAARRRGAAVGLRRGSGGLGSDDSALGASPGGVVGRVRSRVLAAGR